MSIFCSCGTPLTRQVSMDRASEAGRCCVHTDLACAWITCGDDVPSLCSERQLEGEEDNVEEEPTGGPGWQAQDPGRRHPLFRASHNSRSLSTLNFSKCDQPLTMHRSPWTGRRHQARLTQRLMDVRRTRLRKCTHCTGTSLIRNRNPVGSYSGTFLRALWGS